MYFPSHYKEKAAWGSEETASYREKVHEANTIMQDTEAEKCTTQCTQSEIVFALSSWVIFNLPYSARKKVLFC